MADDTTEQYVLDISAQDNASATVNQVNAALTQTLAQTQQLTLANNQAAASVKSIADQMVAAGASAQEIFDATGEQITAGLTAPADAADSSVQNLIHDIGDLGDVVQSLPLRGAGGRFISIPDPELSAFGIDDSGIGDSGGAGGGGDSGGGFNLTGSRRGLTALGSLAGGSPGLSEAARLVSVTAAFGGFGLALGAGAIAIKAVTDAEAARGKAAQDTADQLNQIAQGAAGGTTESINKQLSQYQAQAQTLDDARQKLTLYNSELQQNAKSYEEGTIGGNEYLQNQKNLEQSVSDLTGGTYKLGVGQTDLNDLLTDNQKNIDAVNVSIGGLNIELGTQAVKTNDAADALRKSAADAVSAAQRAVAADQMTTDQRKEREQQLMSEIAIYQQQIEAAGNNSLAQKELGDEQAKLYDEFESLIGVSNTYADTLERQKEAEQALTDANQKTLDLLSQEGDVREKIGNTEADIQQIREDAATKASDLQKDFYAKDDAATAAANEKSLEIEANYTEQRQKIQRDFAASDLQDIGARDAYADLQARTKEQQQLTDAAAADKKAEDQLTKSLNDKYKADYDAYQKSLTQQEQAEAKELAAKDRTLQQEQVDLQNILSGELALSQQYGVGIVSSTQQTWQTVESIFNQIGSSIAYNLNAAANGGATTPIPYSQQVAPLPAVTGTAAGQNNSGNGARSINMTINGVGMGLGEIINHVLTQFDAIVGD